MRPIKVLLALIFIAVINANSTTEQSEHSFYYPIFSYAGQATTSPLKAGLAWSNRTMGWPKNLLGFDANAHWHNWQGVGDTLPCGGRYPVVWSWEGAAGSEGYPYLANFLDWVDYIEGITGKPFAGCVIIINEFDRPDQADMTVAEVAEFMEVLAYACPGCKQIGPSESAAGDGRKIRMIKELLQTQCGSYCMSRWWGHQPHHFPIPQGWDPNTRLTIFCDWFEGPIYWQNGDIYRVNDGINSPCTKPIYPTIGWRTCYPNVGTIFPQWLQQLENNPAVEKYFIFTTYQAPQITCQFSAMLDWAAWPDYVLSPFGTAVKSVLQPQAYP